MKTQKETQKFNVAKVNRSITSLMTNHFNMVKLKLQPITRDTSLDWSWYYAS